MKIYTHEEWAAEARRLFGNNAKHWKFKCCNCGHEQTIADFIAAKIEQPNEKVYFSCIGRWTGGKGTMSNAKQPCNYTLGGLLTLNEVQVRDEEGNLRNVFDFGTPDVDLVVIEPLQEGKKEVGHE